MQSAATIDKAQPHLSLVNSLLISCFFVVLPLVENKIKHCQNYLTSLAIRKQSGGIEFCEWSQPIDHVVEWLPATSNLHGDQSLHGNTWRRRLWTPRRQRCGQRSQRENVNFKVRTSWHMLRSRIKIVSRFYMISLDSWLVLFPRNRCPIAWHEMLRTPTFTCAN